MLILSGVFVSVNAIALLVASSFGSLYFVHNRLQTSADELALLGTSQLNLQDRIGQMNNMIARSRQLVNDADSSNTEAQNNLEHLSEITDQLHNEAREGALLLEQERVKLSQACTQDATNAISNRFAEIRAGHAIALPWLQVAEPTIEITYGRIDAVQSNVAELTGIESLDDIDRAAYITADGSKLYKKNVNAKLAGNDSDLNFKICSLPAPVPTGAPVAPGAAAQYSLSPARATLANKFQVADSDHVSSAVQVKLKLNVATGMGASASSSLEALGTAETAGGQPMF